MATKTTRPRRLRTMTEMVVLVPVTVALAIMGMAVASRSVRPRRPDRSKGSERRQFQPDEAGVGGQIPAAMAMTGAAVALLMWSLGTDAALAIVLMTACGLLFLLGCLNLRWMIDAWWTPENHEMRRSDAVDVDHGRLVSLIVPARHEVDVLESTLEQLAEQAYHNLEVIVVVGHDDPETAKVAQDTAERLGERFEVVVDTSPTKNKPRALNAGLAACTGDIVGVFDAEDHVHPALLQHVVAAFDDASVSVVQGPVQLINHDSTWFTVHNVLEYFFYFGSRLHHHARAGFIPLGGNTVFIRRRIAEAYGGWDAENLTEDCELGVRLSSSGEQVRVIYRPDLATVEEAPITLREFVRQRSRWNQGFIQTYRKGLWRSLPLRQRLLARLILTMPLIQAMTFVLIPSTVLLGVLHGFPLVVALATFLPLTILVTTGIVQLIGLREFARAYDRPLTVRTQIGMLLGMIPYGIVLTYAAMRAMLREARGERGWEKTVHVDAHRSPRLQEATV
ncbi:MAG: glycosyltransferase [Acidimicrobiales bacterium]